MKEIVIAEQFSPTPWGRYPSDGPSNGEIFREKFLRPALEVENVSVVIDGTEGYGSSFLEEAFGGLIRKGYYTPTELRERLSIISNDAEFHPYRSQIWKYIEDAKPPRNR